MFNTSQLASLQLLAESAMVSAGHVVRMVKTSNGQGGTSKAWNNVTSDPVRCRVRREKRDPASKVYGGGVLPEEVSRFKVKFPLGTDVSVMDRFQEVGGPIYELTGTSEGRSFAVELTYDAVLIDDGPTTPPAGPPISTGVHGYEDAFTGDNATQSFTLSHTPVPLGLMFVYVSGALQRNGDYTVTGNVITFNVPPYSDAETPVNVLVRYWGQ